MTQIHLVIRRVNPALKIDLVQAGFIEGSEFHQISFDRLTDTCLSEFVNHSGISDSAYLNHSDIPALVLRLSAAVGFSLDYFDNTLVLMFNCNLDGYEIPSEEEGKGN